MWTWRWTRKQLSCQELVALVTEYLDGALPRRVERRFVKHLETCTSCPEYVDQIRAIVRAAARPDPTAPPVLDPVQLAELFRSLRAD